MKGLPGVISESREPKEWAAFVAGCLPGCRSLAFVFLAGDGSCRKFYRVSGAPRPAVLMVNPDPPVGPGGVDENDSFVYLAGLLREAGAGAPEIFGFDREKGLVLMEDVGNAMLQDLVLARGEDSAWIESTYCRLVDLLAVIQVKAGALLDQARVFSPVYDAGFMYQGESLYFAGFFVEKLCQRPLGGLREELRALALRAGGTIRQNLFLYRDFQSRNIFLAPSGDFRLLDFQGGRLGPPAYDLASLVYDPYVSLPGFLRERLISLYRTRLADLCPSAEDGFGEQFPMIAVHRLMQVLGAYAKLSLVDQKSRFAGYIPQALADLKEMLARAEFDDYGLIRKTVASLEPC